MSERYFPDSMPPPLADAITLPFWQAVCEHRLVVQRCSACGHMQLPPSPVCSECRSDDRGWHEVSGLGEVYTYSIVHRPIAAEQELPFVVIVVSLEGAEGVRLISNLVGVEADAVEIGMPVGVVWEDMSPHLALPRFRPRTS